MGDELGLFVVIGKSYFLNARFEKMAAARAFL